MAVNKDLKESSFAPEMKSSLKEYYLCNKTDNLYEISNRNLDNRINAIRSSSAMIFNLLGQEDISINRNYYGEPEYECKYPAIKDKKGKTHYARLDSVILSKDKKQMIAIEAKMLEWLDTPKKLCHAYIDKERYIKQNDQVSCFISFFKELVKDNKRLRQKSSVFDAIQMTIHILSLYNYCCLEKEHPRSINLCNVVWNYDSKWYKTEEEEGMNYIRMTNEIFPDIFKQKDVNFKVEYLTFSSFKQRLKLSSDRVAYLKRYEID